MTLWTNGWLRLCVDENEIGVYRRLVEQWDGWRTRVRWMEIRKRKREKGGTREERTVTRVI
jgi:hypothetical protein